MYKPSKDPCDIGPWKHAIWVLLLVAELVNVLEVDNAFALNATNRFLVDHLLADNLVRLHQ